ncbi:MAG: hypothetical protein M0Z59_07070 [Nitrospiraceae bacterium]|nr:hypothetical protein [Nitrospiraceae bacterium]
MFYILLGVVVLGPPIHALMNKKRLSGERVLELYLIYLFVVAIGVQDLVTFIGHAFLPALMPAGPDSPAGSAFFFRAEAASADLAFGVLGILCLWLKWNFWLATGIGYAVFSAGSAYGHLKRIILSGGLLAPGALPVLLGNVLYPIAVLTLLFIHIQKKLAQEGA